jgi:hypothetical protein
MVRGDLSVERAPLTERHVQVGMLVVCQHHRDGTLDMR